MDQSSIVSTCKKSLQAINFEDLLILLLLHLTVSLFQPLKLATFFTSSKGFCFFHLNPELLEIIQLGNVGKETSTWSLNKECLGPLGRQIGKTGWRKEHQHYFTVKNPRCLLLNWPKWVWIQLGSVLRPIRN